MSDVAEEAATDDEPLENNVNKEGEKTSEDSIPTTVAEETTRNNKGLSSNPKRRLPVNELALLRTTTLDGLPTPVDAAVNFTTPIAVIDPIEESQMRSADFSQLDRH
ncbi:unnamed protein product [Alternaria alternata]|uniref:Uncharacterized protein n=1 Tax=Alternaria tenuissima TaxID=119927 RepID=A0AB37WGP1_9PLEO|nr:hypothetical protein AA0115_g6055 [Alternaria tenuissima]